MQLTVFVVNWQQIHFLWTVQFNLEAALQSNGVIESDVKEVIKKQLDNAPKRKDDKKTQITQIIGLMQPVLTS